MLKPATKSPDITGHDFIEIIGPQVVKFGSPLVLILLFVSCVSSKNETELMQTKAEYFRKTYLKKFKVLELPTLLPHLLQFKVGDFQYSNPETKDSLIVNKIGMTCYGVLADTSKFYTLIGFAAANTSILAIMTFDNAGNSLGGTSVDYGCWGDGGIGEYACVGGVTIHADLTFDVEHTTTCFDCDSTTNAPVEYINTSKGMISKVGKVEYENHQRDH
jgi:hypothetical protein